MEERYKSLVAMKAEPWIDHFQKTAGHTSVWSKKPQPIVIKQGKNKNTSAASGDDKKNQENLPLTVVSPIEQSNEMAQAELAGKNDKSSFSEHSNSVNSQRKSTTQRVKRKKTGPKSAPNKKIARIKDIFTQHVKR